MFFAILTSESKSIYAWPAMSISVLIVVGGLISDLALNLP